MNTLNCRFSAPYSACDIETYCKEFWKSMMSDFIFYPATKLAVAMSIALTLTACGGEDKYKPPKTPMTMAQFSAKLINHGAVLKFTECPADDAENLDQQNDPFGVLICNEPYTVTYKKETREWVVSGRKERLGVAADALPTMSHAYVGRAPIEGVMNVWGGLYSFNETGAVFSAKLGDMPIGQLDLNL